MTQDSRPLFGALLRQFRLAAGLSQEALAERAHVSVQGISALERGARRTPQHETLALLVEALQITTHDRARLEVAARPLRPRRARADKNDLEEGGPSRHNLPVTLTSFLGRDDDVAAWQRLLRGRRLLTLTGAGGVGKTRLAVEAARSVLGDYPDGVRFVELASLAESELVVHQTAAAIGASLLGDRSVHDSIVASLRHRHTLLIFDNCEHVLTGSAILIDTIVRNSEKVSIMATSRQALGVEGEVVYRVGSLKVPDINEAIDAETAQRYSAVQLFVDRSQAATGRFELTNENSGSVAEICRRLDGIPLAAELAAPKMAVLTPQQLVARLDERFRLLTSGSRIALPRQQTMRAMIDWSYDLLNEGERALFRALSVFAGGWTLSACSEVCAEGGIGPWEVFEWLTSLVEKSLVTTNVVDEEQRYGLLETTRAYARDRLEESAESVRVAAKHARFYAAYLREQRPLWARMDDREWQRAVLTELDNLRAALEWALVAGHDRRVGLELLAELHQPGLVFQPEETLHWYELALDATHDVADDPRLTATIHRRYALAKTLGRASAATSIAVSTAAVAANRVVNDLAALGESLKVLGLALRDAGHLDEADAAYREGWTALEADGCSALKAEILCDWAGNDLKRGEVESARRRFAQALRIARRGSVVHANTLLNLGELQFAQGDFVAARASAQEAKTTFRALESRLYLGCSLCNLAAYAMTLDEIDEARDAMGKALAILRDVGSAYFTLVALEHNGVLAALTGMNDIAAELLGYTDRQLRILGQVREGTERYGFERAVSLLRERLGEDRLSHAMEGGAARSEEDAIKCAAIVQSEVLRLRAEAH